MCDGAGSDPRHPGSKGTTTFLPPRGVVSEHGCDGERITRRFNSASMTRLAPRIRSTVAIDRMPRVYRAGCGVPGAAVLCQVPRAKVPWGARAGAWYIAACVHRTEHWHRAPLHPGPPPRHLFCKGHPCEYNRLSRTSNVTRAEPILRGARTRPLRWSLSTSAIQRFTNREQTGSSSTSSARPARIRRIRCSSASSFSRSSPRTWTSST